MMYQGIIISGTDMTECYEIAKNLELSQSYKIVRVVSNSKKKECYHYIEDDKLARIDKECFLIKIEFDGEIIAIFMQEFNEVIEKKMVPLIIIDKKVVNVIEEFSKATMDLMSFYIYNETKENEGKSARDIKILSSERNRLINKFNYGLNNKSSLDVVALIDKLWYLRERGGGLSRNYIEGLIKCDLLIKDGKLSNVSNSSYDLTLGDEYYYAGEINELSDKKPFLALEPYDYAIASCNEKISMPRDVSGRFDVSVNLFCQGIILSNSTQVDPGFRGKLFCLLFNTSNKVVYLKRHTHFVTMEFNKLIEPTTPYSGKYADEDSIVPYLPTNVMQGAINELKKEIENLKTENQKMQGIYLSVLALFLAIVSIFLTLK